MNAVNERLQAVATELRAAEALLIYAGAGMGVDSGLPDFRGVEGFWKAYPPFRKLGLSFAQLANPHWFEADPGLAWGFYGHRYHLYHATAPHEGFQMLRRWGERLACGARVFTSNVDGHFQKAGFAEEGVYEAHGSLRHLQCTAGCEEIWPAGEMQVEVDPETFRAVGELPRCPGCGALARPNVLMFGDMEWLPARSSVQERRLREWLGGIRGRKLVVVECGAGTAIPTVRHFSEETARRWGGLLVRLNVREPEVPAGQVGIAVGALEGLRAIDAMLSAR